MSNISIEIDAVDNASQVLGGIFDVIKNGGSALDVLGVAATAAAGFVRDAVKDTFDYNEAIKEMVAVTGQTPEAISRMVQVLDDAGVGIDGVKKAMREMAKDGIEPNIAEMAKLSDAYLKINDGAEKGKFLIEHFGKSGAEMARVMELGGAKLLAMNDAVSENLIVTQDAIDASEEYRMNVDELNDSWQGVSNTIGNAVIPILSQVLQGMNNTSAAQSDYNAKLQEVIRLYGDHGDRSNNYRVLLMQEREASIAAADATAAHGTALDGAVTATEELAAATSLTTEELNAMSKANNAQMSLIQKLQTTMTNYNATLAETTEKYGENSAEVQALQAAHQKAMNQIVFDLYLAKLQADGFSDAEFKMALSSGVALGIIDSNTASMALSLDKVVSAAVASGTAITGIATAGSGASSSIQTSMGTASSATNAAGQSAVDAKIKYDDLAGSYDVSVHTTYTSTGVPPTTGGDGTCFVAGTLVSTPNGDVKIELIKAGDFVYSYDEGEIITAEIEETFEHSAIEYLSINGLKVTAEHLLYSEGKWVAAGSLNIGNYLQDKNGDEVLIYSIEKKIRPAKVYNLHTKHKSHNYFAGGYLVHNTKTARVATGERTAASTVSGYAAPPQTQDFDYDRFARSIRDAFQATYFSR